MAGKGAGVDSGQTSPDEHSLPESLWGFRVVNDSGDQLPSPCGTEEANEGDAYSEGLPSGQKWAKRKFKAGPINSKSGPGVY